MNRSLRMFEVVTTKLSGVIPRWATSRYDHGSAESMDADGPSGEDLEPAKKQSEGQYLIEALNTSPE